MARERERLPRYAGRPVLSFWGEGEGLLGEGECAVEVPGVTPEVVAGGEVAGEVAEVRREAGAVLWGEGEGLLGECDCAVEVGRVALDAVSLPNERRQLAETFCAVPTSRRGVGDGLFAQGNRPIEIGQVSPYRESIVEAIRNGLETLIPFAPVLRSRWHLVRHDQGVAHVRLGVSPGLDCSGALSPYSRT